MKSANPWGHYDESHALPAHLLGSINIQKWFVIRMSRNAGKRQTKTTTMEKTIYVVGIISDQVQNNHAAWVVGGKSFEDYDEA